MAKKWTNENLPGALHYVTGNVVDRNRIFEVEANCIAFLEELQTLRSKNCKLIAFVLMPDHFHITLNPKDGDIQTTIGELKEFSAKKISQGRGQIWQESFKALPLWSPWMIKQKHNYIHSNPVRAGLVSRAEDYKWSSFRAFYFEEPNPLLQVDKEWWWPDDVRKLEVAMGEKQKALDEEFEKERALKFKQ